MSPNAAVFLRTIVSAIVLTTLSMSTAFAHGEHHPEKPHSSVERVGPAALVQLEEVREATFRYVDVDAAVADGYVDIGAFVSGMGWHYVNANRIDQRFNAERPEILVYADDPCGGKRRLVAVEYAIPLPLSKRAPDGFVGRADQWHKDESLGLWTLHAWVWEYNPDGVFAPFNPRIP